MNGLTAEDLKLSMKNANDTLQVVTYFLRHSGETDLTGLKLRIPTEIIRTVRYFKLRLGCVKNPVLQKNLAYQLQLSDFFFWLLERTNISYSVREMIIKYSIVIMGSVAESLTFEVVGKKLRGFNDRVDFLRNKGMISDDCVKELKWLWVIRGGIHPFELTHKEFDKYKAHEFKRAFDATRALLDELNRTN